MLSVFILCAAKLWCHVTISDLRLCHCGCSLPSPISLPWWKSPAGHTSHQQVTQVTSGSHQSPESLSNPTGVLTFYQQSHYLDHSFKISGGTCPRQDPTSSVTAYKAKGSLGVVLVQVGISLLRFHQLGSFGPPIKMNGSLNLVHRLDRKGSKVLGYRSQYTRKASWFEGSNLTKLLTYLLFPSREAVCNFNGWHALIAR